MTAHEMVAKARNLPQVPGAALRLVGLLDASNDNKEVIEVIKSDALLTAKLLRVCNSSALGLAEPVSSVDHAILLLGHSQVMSLALSLAFGKAMTSQLPSVAMEADKLWRHSFMAATAAEIIVNRGFYSGVEPPVAFTAGLLHDVGKLVMGQSLSPEAHASIKQHSRMEGLGSTDAEREVCGTDHAEVGACLLHVWRLPDSLIEAVANHHRLILEPKLQLSAVAHLGNRFSHIAEAGPGSENYAFRPNDPILQAFDMGPAEEEACLVAVKESAERSAELMKIG
jgi:putative nucleotidyltransferase with HDIG domain